MAKNTKVASTIRTNKVNKKQQRIRYFSIDVARGTAIAMMIAFHFSYDLNYFHFVDFDFYRDPFWLNFRTLIITLFLCLVGVSLQLSTGQGLNHRRYFSRLALLIGSAMIVTIGSYLMFPKNAVLFGVLHFIALASVIGLLFRTFYWLNFLLGIGIIILGNLFQHEWFNLPTRHWIGFMPNKPQALDYVPLIPWLGVVLIGMFLAQITKKHGLLNSDTQKRSLLTRLLAQAGRHSLLIYLLHQPLLFAGFYLVNFMNSVNIHIAKV